VRIRPQPAVELVTPPEDVVLGQVCRIREQFVHAVNDVTRPMPDYRIGQRLDDHLRADAGGVSHGDRDGRAVVHFRVQQ
jgi:hypothetical protein